MGLMGLIALMITGCSTPVATNSSGLSFPQVQYSETNAPGQ